MVLSSFAWVLSLNNAGTLDPVWGRADLRYCCGFRIDPVRLLSLKLRRGEEQWLAFVIGSAVLSAVVFILCCIHLAFSGVLVCVVLVAILVAWRTGAYRARCEALPEIAAKWKWIIGITYGAFVVLYFFNAMAHEMSTEGSSYHLSVTAAYYQAHVERMPWTFYDDFHQYPEYWGIQRLASIGTTRRH
jgi:hypothetical protein